MATVAVVLNVLIASPSDVAAERDAVEAAILAWNATNRRGGVVLRPVRWERDASPGTASRAQELLNSQFVDDCDFAIAIFKDRLGSPTGTAPSGTVEEINRLESAGRPVFVYFCRQSGGGDEAQRQAVVEFKRERSKRSVYGEPEDVGDLKFRVSKDLFEIVPQVVEATGLRAVPEVHASLHIDIQSILADSAARPTFSVEPSAALGRADSFTPEFRARQIGGEPVATVEYQIQALGESGGWKQLSATQLPGTKLIEQLDLRLPRQPIAVGSMGCRIRFHWRGRWHHELHRWNLLGHDVNKPKARWEVGDELLPAIHWVSDDQDAPIPGAEPEEQPDV